MELIIKVPPLVLGSMLFFSIVKNGINYKSPKNIYSFTK